MAVDDPLAATTAEDTAVTTANVLTNDTLVDNAAITAFDVVSTNSTVANVEHNGDGTFNYTPPPDFNGDDTFTYQISDTFNA